MPRFALGLFHFNTQYVAGDNEIADRYCREAIDPFLRAVERRPGWRVSFEIAGSGLEFLASRHGRIFDLLRSLVNCSKIELISSLYVPSIWIAFPRRDLIQSVTINRECLRDLGVKDSGIFFSQEAFFGPGVGTLAEFFDSALCKDEYLDYFIPESERLSPQYQLGRMRVIAGSGHLANLLAREYLEAESLPYPYRRRLECTSVSIPGGTRSLECGALGDVEWVWYHMGSGHHFATPYSPEDMERFFFDPDWAAMNMRLLDQLEAQGFRFSPIREFADSVKHLEAPPLSPLVEGSWNTARSFGVFEWMGRHSDPWENDPEILGHAWRAREGLVLREIQAPDVQSDFLISEALQAAWKQQLLAESSDPLGWDTTPAEVKFGRISSEQALASAFALGPIDPGKSDLPGEFKLSNPFTGIEVFGGTGSFTVCLISEVIQQVDIHIEQSQAECGVRFARSEGPIMYCPSGLEDDPARVEFESLRQEVLYLPLSNGLVSLGNDLAVIRVNRYGMCAARLARLDPHVTFGVDGGRRGTVLRWRFLMYRGAIESAVELANTTNLV